MTDRKQIRVDGPRLSWRRAYNRRWLVLTTSDGSTDGYRRWYRPYLALWALWDYAKAQRL